MTKKNRVLKVRLSRLLETRMDLSVATLIKEK